jgi:hypothetical protein
MGKSTLDLAEYLPQARVISNNLAQNKRDGFLEKSETEPQQAVAARVIVAPVARQFEPTLPDAQPVGPGVGFLAPVIAGGRRQTFRDENGRKIGVIDGAAGQQALIAVSTFGLALHRRGGQQFGHAVARDFSTGPVPARSILAGLCQFRCIEPQQPNTVIPEPETVAIAGLSPAGDRRMGRFEPGNDHGQHRQNGYGEGGAAPAGKKPVSVALSIQDFTAR